MSLPNHAEGLSVHVTCALDVQVVFCVNRGLGRILLAVDRCEQMIPVAWIRVGRGAWDSAAGTENVVAA